MTGGREAIRAGIRALSEGFTAGDVERVMEVFGSSPVTLTPNESPNKGREAIREWHSAIFSQFEGEAELVPTEIEVSGGLAYAKGTYAMDLVADDGSEVGDRGKFLMIWKRAADGDWRLARNIWNSDQPLPSI